MRDAMDDRAGHPYHRVQPVASRAVVVVVVAVLPALQQRLLAVVGAAAVDVAVAELEPLAAAVAELAAPYVLAPFQPACDPGLLVYEPT